MLRSIVVTLVGVLLALPSLAAAQDRPRQRGEVGVVVAESFYGHGTATAPVRRNSKGRTGSGTARRHLV